MPAPNTSTDVIPIVDSSIRKSNTETAKETILVATWSATPTTVNGTSQSQGLR